MTCTRPPSCCNGPANFVGNDKIRWITLSASFDSKHLQTRLGTVRISQVSSSFQSIRSSVIFLRNLAMHHSKHEWFLNQSQFFLCFLKFLGFSKEIKQVKEFQQRITLTTSSTSKGVEAVSSAVAAAAPVFRRWELLPCEAYLHLDVLSSLV